MKTTNGIIDTCDDNCPKPVDGRRISYRQIGTIQLLRGDRFVMSIDEKQLPEGTRALYVREPNESLPF